MDPSVSDIDKIKATIKKIKKEGYINTVRLGGMTDPFQPLEATKKITNNI